MTTWRKSSYSGAGDNRECVELAQLPGAVGVRDSKNPAGRHLTLRGEVFGGLVAAIKSGTYDR